MKPQDAYSWVTPDILDSVDPAAALVDTEAVEFYEQRMSFFFHECVKLNTDLHIAEKVLAFPFDVFSNHAENVFWPRILNSIFEATLVRFTKLADDTSHDVFSLPPFRTWVIKHTRDEYQGPLRRRLAACRFEHTTKEVRERVRAVRTNIAHLRKSFLFGEEAPPTILLSDLKSLLDSVNQLFDALLFNMKHQMLPIMYAPGVRHPEGFTSDIDEILDAVALRSVILNQPETNPQLWAIHLKFAGTEAPEQLAWITKYRRTFGLPTPWESADTKSS